MLDHQYMDNALRTIGSNYHDKPKLVKKNGAYLFGRPNNSKING